MKVIATNYHDKLKVVTVLDDDVDEIAWANTYLGLYPDMPPPSFVDITEFDEFGDNPRSASMRYVVLRNEHGYPYITKENNPT